jgi:putative heme degradation protein
MALIRNGDAVAEIEVPGHSWYINGDWLNWIDAGYNLHIRLAATVQILALIRSGKRGPTYSFNLVNQAGQVFCRFYARTAADKSRFELLCTQYQ